MTGEEDIFKNNLMCRSVDKKSWYDENDGK